MRGYVRNYARLLKLDPEPLIGALSSGRATPAAVRTVQTVSESPRWIWPAIGVTVTIAVLIGVVASLLQKEPERPTAVAIPENATMSPAVIPETPSDGLSPLTEETTDSLVTTANPSNDTLIEVDHDDATDDGAEDNFAGEDTAGEDTAGSDTAGENIAAENVPATESGDAGALTETAVISPATPIVQKRRLNGGNKDTIRLHFTADCWVRIKDPSGKMLFSGMGRAGGGMELSGTGPFDLLLGFAPGASLSWNGTDFDLAPHMRNNVATVVLDRAAIGAESDG